MSNNEAETSVYLYTAYDDIPEPTTADLLKVAYARALDEDEPGQVRVAACSLVRQLLADSRQLQQTAAKIAALNRSLEKAEKERRELQAAYDDLDAAILRRDIVLRFKRAGSTDEEVRHELTDSSYLAPDGSVLLWTADRVDKAIKDAHAYMAIL